jgi:hypothetical protein
MTGHDLDGLIIKVVQDKAPPFRRSLAFGTKPRFLFWEFRVFKRSIEAMKMDSLGCQGRERQRCSTH